MQDLLLRRLGIGLVISASAMIAVGVLAASVKYQPYGVPESKRPQFERLMEQVAEQRSIASQPVSSTNSPVAVTDSTEYDFGLMDPLTEASHEFRVRNEGHAVLSLIASETSCKCTLSSVADRLVAPGEETTITLTWNSGRNREFYRQYALIKTNDPQRPEIELGVRGRVRSEFASSAQEVVFTDLEPGEESVRRIGIFSQTWNRFEIGEIRSDIEGLTWTLQPMTAEELDEFDAQSGFAVSLQLGSDRPAGYFSGTLRLALQPDVQPPLGAVRGGRVGDSDPNDAAGIAADDADAPAADADAAVGNIEISIRGKVLLPISLYGPTVHAIDGIQIGSVPIGEAKTVKALVKVRGSRQPAYVRVGSIVPELLDAKIVQTSRPDFYELVIQVPADAPQVNFNGELAGEMILESDVLDGGQMRIGIQGDTMGKPTGIGRGR